MYSVVAAVLAQDAFSAVYAEDLWCGFQHGFQNFAAYQHEQSFRCVALHVMKVKNVDIDSLTGT